MKSTFVKTWQARVLALCLLVPFWGTAQQFVELTAQIEIASWWSSSDLRVDTYTARCVVRTNSWWMNGYFARNAQVTCWFTGTNIVKEALLADGSLLPMGTRHTQSFVSEDGNPGRPVRTLDLLNLQETICWLAYCSGPALRREHHQLYPVSDLWKETLVPDRSGFKARTVVFDDPLGLPRSVNLYTAADQPAFQYRVTSFTNVLGWDFPTEFQMVQYRRASMADSPLHGTNGWELAFSAKGRLTSISSGTKPELPLPRARSDSIKK